MVKNAVVPWLMGYMMKVAKEMIRTSGDRPEWVAEVGDQAHLCEVHHANDGGLSNDSAIFPMLVWRPSLKFMDFFVTDAITLA
jgi:hypothetical protein